MNKQEIYNYLKEQNIWHEVTEHKAVFNMEELAEVDIPYPEADAKNLFVRADKKRNYYLITVKGEFLEGRKLIGVHPNENTATVWLKTEDLLDIIKEHGNPVQVLEL